MYTKHHTEGIVLRSFDSGESDRGYYIFTRNLGLVFARAQSVRELKSKMRFSLQELSHGNFSLVRARGTWKITNSSSVSNIYYLLANNPKKLAMFSRVFVIVRRLVRGEEKNENLYNIFSNTFLFLKRHSLSDDDIKNLETLIVLRTLNELGYLGGTKQFDYLLSSPYISDVSLGEVKRLRPRAVLEINRAFEEIQM